MALSCKGTPKIVVGEGATSVLGSENAVMEILQATLFLVSGWSSSFSRSASLEDESEFRFLFRTLWRVPSLSMCTLNKSFEADSGFGS